MVDHLDHHLMDSYVANSRSASRLLHFVFAFRSLHTSTERDQRNLTKMDPIHRESWREHQKHVSRVQLDG